MWGAIRWWWCVGLMVFRDFFLRFSQHTTSLFSDTPTNTPRHPRRHTTMHAMRAVARAPTRPAAARATRPPPRRAMRRPAVTPRLARALPPTSLPLPPGDDDTVSSPPLSFASDDASDASDSDSGASIALPRPRRSRLVAFTCNKCDGRTERSVNPRAWDRGTVFLQCGECGAWHNVKDELKLIDEVRFPRKRGGGVGQGGAGGGADVWGGGGAGACEASDAATGGGGATGAGVRDKLFSLSVEKRERQ